MVVLGRITNNQSLQWIQFGSIHPFYFSRAPISGGNLNNIQFIFIPIRL